MLGDTLKKLRNEKGATQDDMALLLNIKRQTYSAYERNVSLPDIQSLIKLASFFSVTVGYLIEDEIKAANGKQPLSQEQQNFLKICSDMNDEEMSKVIEYAQLLKLKRKS